MKQTSTLLFLRNLGATAACAVASQSTLDAATVFQLKTQAAAAGQGVTAASFGAPMTVSTGSVRSSVTAASFGTPATITAVPSAPPMPQTSSAPEGSRAPEASAPRANKTPRGKVIKLPPDFYAGRQGSSKEGMPAPTFIANDPGAFALSVDAGYSTKHVWRGIDLVEFTSFNHTSGGRLPDAESAVSFVGVNTTYKGFGFGAKYIESVDDQLNPFFSVPYTDLDSYQEFVLSSNYTKSLLDGGLLDGTVGFDFYYYPNDEFWGVEHQGMLYLRFANSKYKWARPFVEMFYNIATDQSGTGWGNTQTGFTPPVTSFRGATGSDLVEGYGAEVGVNGGDVVYKNDQIAVGLTYSLSSFYKSGYAFEDDGLTHVSLTFGVPVSFGSNFTITPSLTYVQALADIAPKTNAQVQDDSPAAYNEPGFLGAVKVSWTF